MASVPCPATQLGAGIDWVTATAKRPSSVRALLYVGEDLLDQEEGAGGVRKAWHWQGFQGHQAGRVQAGFSGTIACVRASGPTARECARDIIACADNISRLDVQITVSSSALGADYAERVYRGHGGAVRGRGKPIARTLMMNSDGGSTLYLGKGASDQYGRVYNKTAEQKTGEDPPHWRYEVEYKRHLALAAGRSYALAAEKDRWCLSEVVEWFERRHCPPPISAISRVGLRGDSRGSDAQANRLRWLKVGVRPVVRKLAAEYGWPDVLALLGVPMTYSERYVNESLGPVED